MRLLLLTARYPSRRRPTTATFNRELVAGLREAGDDVRVVAPVAWTDLLLASSTGTAEPEVSYPIWWYPPRMAQASHHRWMQRTVLPTIARLTATWRPDLMLAYWTHPDGTVALEAARRLQIPAALLVGGSDILVLTRTPARRAIIIETLRRADRVLAVGSALRQNILALGVPPEQVGVFHRGVDTTRFHPGDPLAARARLSLPLDRPVFVWVGRMVAVKGLDVLFDAWNRIRDHATRPLLLLIGDGEQRNSLQRRAASWSDTVRFIGPVAHAELPDWYRAADAVLLPSRSEGVPNVLLESLACGTPFIASDVGGVRELADRVSVVVPPDNAAALAAALVERLRQPVLSLHAEGAVPARSEAVAALREELRSLISRPARMTAAI
jgi:teichuronic acid biosynthesis glycosyltransferase TuaC